MQSNEPAGDAERDRRHDQDRVAPVAEDGDEQQIDDDDRHDVIAGQRVSGRLKLIIRARYPHGDALRNLAGLIEVVHDLLAHHLHAGLKRDRGRRDYVERHRSLSVDAPYGAGVDGFLHLRQRRKRHHDPLWCVHGQLANGVECRTEAFTAVEENVDLFIIKVEVAGKRTIGECCNCKAQLLGRHAEFSGAFPVRANFDQWLGERQGRRIRLDTRIVEHFARTPIGRCRNGVDVLQPRA